MKNGETAKQGRLERLCGLLGVVYVSNGVIADQTKRTMVVRRSVERASFGLSSMVKIECSAVSRRVQDKKRNEKKQEVGMCNPTMEGPVHRYFVTQPERFPNK